jgi:hypothetical protein
VWHYKMRCFCTSWRDLKSAVLDKVLGKHGRAVFRVVIFQVFLVELSWQ